MLDSSLNFCDHGMSSFHVVGKILVKVIRVVVVELKSLEIPMRKLENITMDFLVGSPHSPRGEDAIEL